MTDEPNASKPRLVPARPDFGEAKRSGFLPRLPWRYLAGLALLVAIVIAGFNWRQAQRAAALRVEIRKIHEQDLRELRGEYQGALDKLQKLISGAADLPVEPTEVDGRLRLETLRGQPGLYLRVPLEDAAHVDDAALQMEPDWIPGCLGWNPTTARELYEIGAFLQPEFIAKLDEENVMKLRVREDTLSQRMEKDVAGLRAAMNAPWFMLVLQEGPSRSEQPVRVFLWDMRENKLVLRARVRAQGILLTSKIYSQGETRQGAGKPNEGGAAAANDCSIASALKRLTSPPAAAPAPTTP
jgi:hypothetical protein